ncbi:MAG: hypothetical protein DMF89_00160 [Acidobacteria bacterium]|nr:MAG: hypothetical protein DMF89_00160 [Acidobacteriota bacterium]
MLAYTTLLLSAQGLVTETTPRRGGNPNAAKRANPLPRSPASVEAGRRTYQRLCARCHGIAGKGDGGGAGAGGQPADLTDATWEFGSTDGAAPGDRDLEPRELHSYSRRSPGGQVGPTCPFEGRRAGDRQQTRRGLAFAPLAASRHPSRGSHR